MRYIEPPQTVRGVCSRLFAGAWRSLSLPAFARRSSRSRAHTVATRDSSHSLIFVSFFLWKPTSTSQLRIFYMFLRLLLIRGFVSELLLLSAKEVAFVVRVLCVRTLSISAVSADGQTVRWRVSYSCCVLMAVMKPFRSDCRRVRAFSYGAELTFHPKGGVGGEVAHV